MQFQNGSNKVAIELQVMQFWPEIILVNSNRTRTVRSFDFEITRRANAILLVFEKFTHAYLFQIALEIM